MKLNTVVIIAKGVCYLLVGTFTPWVAAMGQWTNSGEMAPRSVWIGIILPLSVIGGAGSLLAFLSASFKDFKDTKDEEDATETKTTTTTETKTEAVTATPVKLPDK